LEQDLWQHLREQLRRNPRITSRRPVGTFGNPLLEQPLLLLAKRFALGGHDVVVTERQTETMHQLAAVGLPGDDAPIVFVAFQEGKGARIEPQVTLLLLGTMAFDAARDQDR